MRARLGVGVRVYVYVYACMHICLYLHDLIFMYLFIIQMDQEVIRIHNTKKIIHQFFFLPPNCHHIYNKDMKGVIITNRYR